MVGRFPGFYTVRLSKGLPHHHFDLPALGTEAVAQGLIIDPSVIPSIFWQLEQIYTCMAKLSKERHVRCTNLKEKESPY